MMFIMFFKFNSSCMYDPQFKTLAEKTWGNCFLTLVSNTSVEKLWTTLLYNVDLVH